MHSLVRGFGRAALTLGFAAAFAAALPAIGAGFTVPPAPHHHVTDNAGVLDDATTTAVETELKAYETRTGHQIIVWIGRTTGGVPLETWTAETAHEWKVGRSKKDDGVVLFLFMDDRKVRIEVGYGLEGSLTDADAKRIIDDDITPRLRAGDPNAAVTGGVAAIIKTITPSTTGVVEARPATRSNVSGIITACVIGFFLLIGAIVLVGQVLRLIWFGILVMGEGAKKANASMDNSGWRFLGGGIGFGGGGLFSGWSSSDSSSSGDSSSGDDDFSSGGGDFGGGGASGSW